MQLTDEQKEAIEAVLEYLKDDREEYRSVADQSEGGRRQS